MIVINAKGDIDTELERCECICGCQTAANFYDLLWAESGNEPVDVLELADPNATLDWRLVCVRCYQDRHSAYELAVIAVALKEL